MSGEMRQPKRFRTRLIDVSPNTMMMSATPASAAE